MSINAQRNASERVNESNDVWFFGSSTCYSGIDPHALQAFGFNGFNFCSSSQAITNSEYILGAATHHHDPAIIALDVYPLDLGELMGPE